MNYSEEQLATTIRLTPRVIQFRDRVTSGELTPDQVADLCVNTGPLPTQPYMIRNILRAYGIVYGSEKKVPDPAPKKEKDGLDELGFLLYEIILNLEDLALSLGQKLPAEYPEDLDSFISRKMAVVRNFIHPPKEQ